MLKIGDRVVVNKVGQYAVTQKGSRGTVMHVGETFVTVEFDFITSGIYSTKNIYTIHKEHLDLYNPLPIDKQVCLKIKQLEDRYVSRHRSRQSSQGCQADLVHSGEAEAALLGVFTTPSQYTIEW